MRLLFTAGQVDAAKLAFKDAFKLILPSDQDAAEKLAEDFWNMRFHANSRGEFTAINMELLKTRWGVEFGIRGNTNNVTERSTSPPSYIFWHCRAQ